jgi:protein-tyrosine-phosphatase
MTGRTVVFVCAHGAARSRIAAAWFNADPPPGWHATTAAGDHPSAQLNPHVAALLAGTSAARHLDRSQPRPLPAADGGDLLIAVDCALPGAHLWTLAADELDEAMRDELRDRVATLAETLRAEACQITDDDDGQG